MKIPKSIFVLFTLLLTAGCIITPIVIVTSQTESYYDIIYPKYISGKISMICIISSFIFSYICMLSTDFRTTSLVIDDKKMNGDKKTN